MYKLCFCCQTECQKCTSRQSEDLNFKKFQFAVHPGDTSWKQSQFRSFLQGGELNFSYFHRREGESGKLKKEGGSMVLGQVFLKGEGLAFWLSNFFKVNFYVYKLLLYSLRNCVMHLNRNYFFLAPGHFKLSKIEPENIPSVRIM